MTKTILIFYNSNLKHGNHSEQKLAYSHVDIAGSSGPFPGKPTGSPLPSFFNKYLLPRL